MADERWTKLQDLYSAAAALSPEEQRRFLDANCPDADLRAEVEALLDHSGDSPTFDPVTPLAGVVQIENELQTGTTIGDFELVRVIGAGGMGRVYEAEQSQPKRTVALKVMRLAFANDNEMRRFRYESETLAQLQHPNIAQLFQVGTYQFDGGLGQELPYFAMEYVPDGRNLVRHARDRGLSISEKLQLFTEACAAVQHGHERGVIHRDLKPANILVGANDAVKVIDFGISRATERDQDQTRLTMAGAIIGTPAYLAPELLLDPTRPAGVRSDVYALGVVLFELLSGQLPHNPTDTPLHDLGRTVANAPTPRLSAVLPDVSRELEWIATKAIDADPERRYESAAALAEDLARYGRNEPVSAGPPGVGYRARKFVRRHRFGASVAAVVAVALVAGLTMVLISYQQVQQQFIQKTQAVTFFTEMLTESDPGAGGRETRLFDAIQRHAHRIDTQFADQPTVRELLHTTVGNVLSRLGHPEAGEPHLQKAYKLSVELNGKEEALRAGPASALGSTLLILGRRDESREILEQVVAVREKTLPTTDRRLALSNKDLGTLEVESGRPRAAVERMRRAYELCRENFGPADHDSLRCSTYYASALHDVGSVEAAAACLEESWEIVQAQPDANVVVTMAVCNQLALLRLAQRRIDEAESLLVDGLERGRLPFGELHPERLRMQHNLARVYRAQGRSKEAEALLDKAVVQFRDTLGDDHLDTLRTQMSLTGLYHETGRSQEAVATATSVLKRIEASTAPSHPVGIAARNALAVVLIEQGSLSRAAALLTETEAITREHYEASDGPRLHTLSNYGALLLRQKQFPKAEGVLREVLEARKKKSGNEVGLLTVLQNIAHAASEQGRKDEARKQLEEVIAMGDALDLKVHPVLLSSRANLASIYSAAGDYDRAIEHQRWVLDIRMEALGETHPNTILSMNNIAVTCQRKGDLDQAEQYLLKAVTAARNSPGFNQTRLGQYLFNYGASLYKLKRFSEARDAIQESHKILLAQSGPDDDWVRDAVEWLADLDKKLAGAGAGE